MIILLESLHVPIVSCIFISENQTYADAYITTNNKTKTGIAVV